jgi:hypothetical protein
MKNPRPSPPGRETEAQKTQADRLERRVKELMMKGWSEVEARKLARIQLKNRPAHSA